MAELSQYEGLRKKPHKKGPMAIPIKQAKPGQRANQATKITMGALATLALIDTVKAGTAGPAQGEPQQVTNTNAATVLHVDTPKPPPLVKREYFDLLTRNPKSIQHEALRKLIDHEKEAVRKIATNPFTGSESASVAIIKKWNAKISQEASKHNVSSQVAAAIALIENHGGENKVSSEGAVGIYQLLEDAARQTEVIYEKDGVTKDNRTNPLANIEGGIEYLALQRDYFGDLGFGILSFYGGYATLVRLLDVHSDYTLPTPKQASIDFDAREEIRQYIKANSLSVYDLLSDEKVKTFIKEDRGKKPKEQELPPAIMEYVPRVAVAAEYLVVHNIVEPEVIEIDIPQVPSPPKPRTVGAVV